MWRRKVARGARRDARRVHVDGDGPDALLADEVDVVLGAPALLGRAVQRDLERVLVELDLRAGDARDLALRGPAAAEDEGRVVLVDLEGLRDARRRLAAGGPGRRLLRRLGLGRRLGPRGGGRATLAAAAALVVAHLVVGHGGRVGGVAVAGCAAAISRAESTRRFGQARSPGSLKRHLRPLRRTPLRGDGRSVATEPRLLVWALPGESACARLPAWTVAMPRGSPARARPAPRDPRPSSAEHGDRSVQQRRRSPPTTSSARGRVEERSRQASQPAALCAAEVRRPRQGFEMVL